MRRRVRLRLSVRVDPVRHFADAPRRHCGPARHRLRQYRRHQCPAHGPQGARRRDAFWRHAQGHGRGVRHRVISLAAIRPSLAAVGAFFGHLFPVWLRFRGGKGVATYIGLLLGFVWPAAIMFCAVWLVVAAATRYSSLAALIASAATPAFLWWRDDFPEAQMFLALSVLLWLMHRQHRQLSPARKEESASAAKSAPCSRLRYTGRLLSPQPCFSAMLATYGGPESRLGWGCVAEARQGVHLTTSSGSIGCGLSAARMWGRARFAR